LLAKFEIHDVLQLKGIKLFHISIALTL